MSYYMYSELFWLLNPRVIECSYRLRFAQEALAKQEEALKRLEELIRSEESTKD